MQKARRLIKALNARGIRLSDQAGCLDYISSNGSLSTDDEAQLKDYKNDILQTIRAQHAIRSRPSIRRGCKPLQLSLAQDHMLSLLRSGKILTLSAKVEVRLYKTSHQELCSAITRLMSAHEILRYRIERTRDGDVLGVNPLDEFEVELEDLDGEDQAATELSLQRFSNNQISLDDRWLIRAKHFVLGNGRSLVVFLIHHIVFDRVSASILVEDLHGYLDDKSQAPDIQYSYADIADWERRTASSEAGKILAEYWCYWHQNVPKLQDPTTGLPLTWREGDSDVYTFKSPAADIERIASLARRRGSTPFIVVLTSLAWALGHWSQQKTFWIASTGTTRASIGAARIIGPMLTCDFIEVDLSDITTVLELHDRMREEYLFAIRARPPSLTQQIMLESSTVHRGVTINYSPVGDQVGANEIVELGTTITPVRIKERRGALSPIFVWASHTDVGMNFVFQFNEQCICRVQQNVILSEFASAWKTVLMLGGRSHISA